MFWVFRVGVLYRFCNKKSFFLVIGYFKKFLFFINMDVIVFNVI